MFASFSFEYALKKDQAALMPISENQSILASTQVSFQKSQLKNLLMKNTKSLHVKQNSETQISQNKFSPLQNDSLKTSIFFNARKNFKKHDEKVLIKSEWRAMYNCQIFQDYLFLRDAKAMKDLNLLLLDECEDKPLERMFQTEEQERQFHELQRKIQFEKLKQSFKDNNVNLKEKQPQTISISQLQIAHNTLSVLSRKILTSELEAVQPSSESLMKTFSEAGLVNFYLISIYLHSLIVQIYGRRVISYQNWKRFLRICNLNGKPYYKYKLVGYKHISKCCVDLGNYEKATVYLKKMLKLSWVINDRNYELLSYDMLAVVLYYTKDLQRAMFFHEKFVKGEYEAENSNVRNLGSQNYNLGLLVKERMLDQNSFSEDDFDLEVIIHQSNLLSWQREQKRRDHVQNCPNNGNIKKDGISFGKSDFRNKKESHGKMKMVQINEYKKRAQVMLGPIYKKAIDGEKDKKMQNNII